MRDDIEKTVVSQEQIAAKVQELAEAITRDYAGKEPLVIVILKGGIFFAADLLRRLSFPLDLDFMAAASYGSFTEPRGAVDITKDVELDVDGRHVLIVEDVIDSGRTMRAIVEELWQRGPASLNVCVLLDKPAQREVDIPLAYVGFDIGAEFVVGYGMDYAEKYRQLPYVAVLREEAMKSAVQ